MLPTNSANALNRPTNALQIDAFNLWPGATLHQGDRRWVVTHVERTPELEQVDVWVRQINPNRDDRTLRREAFSFDYNHVVTVIGNVVVYEDTDDDNYGARDTVLAD